MLILLLCLVGWLRNELFDCVADGGSLLIVTIDNVAEFVPSLVFRIGIRPGNGGKVDDDDDVVVVEELAKDGDAVDEAVEAALLDAGDRCCSDALLLVIDLHWAWLTSTLITKSTPISIHYW